jgi:hypothetical protein
VKGKIMSIEESMKRLDAEFSLVIENFPLHSLKQDLDAMRELTDRLVLAVAKAGFAIVEKEKYDKLLQDSKLLGKTH